MLDHDSVRASYAAFGTQALVSLWRAFELEVSGRSRGESVYDVTIEAFCRTRMAIIEDVLNGRALATPLRTEGVRTDEDAAR